MSSIPVLLLVERSYTLVESFDPSRTFPRTSEKKIPQQQRMAKMTKPAWMLINSSSATSGVIITGPINREIITIAIPMDNI
jgi:hypothetical protein